MKFSNGKIAMFFKRNILYIILAFCILAIGLSVMFVLLNETPSNPNSGNVGDDIVVELPNDSDKPDIPVDSEKPDIDQPDEPVVDIITFIMPVESVLAIEDYSEQLVFNQTMGRYSSHKAIDFFAPEGTSVYAVYDGKIIKVENNPLITGVTITIDHGNGLTTVYNSLADGEQVFEGQTVKQGDVIGTVSVTNRQEYKEGAHLHFSVVENGETINQNKYLIIEEK